MLMEVHPVLTAAEIIAKMREAVPPGKQQLAEGESRCLRELTRALIASKPEAIGEHDRFLSISGRGIGLPAGQLGAWLGGKKVLVTGGTGCIGSALMAQVENFRPGGLVSVSRGPVKGSRRVPGAEYARADIRDGRRLAAVVRDLRPDVIFHVAAQRDPGLAEHEVHRTVTTNVLGTRNVIAAAAESCVPQVVSASTGKALRPYSPDVYTASKRVAEWLLAQAAADSPASYSAARFTHVVDNSIIYARLLDWCQGGVIRLHDADIAFYAQSALESAQLLLGAGIGACPGALRIHAITDLGWPVCLLDVALGMLTRTGSGAPVYFSGYDRGYEAAPFPGLYDPMTAGDVSPLLSAFEAGLAGQSSCPAAGAFSLEIAPVPELADGLLALEDTCARTQEPAPVRAALDELSWSLLGATLQAVPREVLARTLRLAAPHRAALNTVHQRMLAAIEHCVTVGESSLVLARPAGTVPHSAVRRRRMSISLR
jgi:Polysaccharide biosynthesis protein